MIATIFTLLGSLGVFLYGMRVMSDGIQKVAGQKMQTIMNYMTANRFVAILTGFLITALIQSSSATTVMVVSFVNAGLLSLTQAVGVIMGANIGTTVTTWIVSIIGFKFKITAIALPIIGVGLPFIFSKFRKRRDIGEILIGFGLLFLGLMFLKESVPDIKSNPEVLEFLKNYTDLGFLSFVIFVFVGSILTVFVQSSSAAMAITVTMAYMGWINFETAAAIVLGENIGTTVTAYLASLGTSVNARRTARAHFFFNIFGVLWMAIVFRYFTQLVLKLAPWDSGLQSNLPLNLSLFHTCFNLINTLIFLPFVRPFSKFIASLVKPKDRDKSTLYKLEYISRGLQDTAQINILEAKSELIKMAEVTYDMFDTFLHVFNNPDKKLGDKVEEVKKLEELTDQMQEEITKFLVECSKEELSEHNVMNVNAMMRIVNELENIGDSCFKLMILTERKYLKKIQLHEKAMKEFNDISDLLLQFMGIYKKHMTEKMEGRVLDMAFKLEGKINILRDSLKKSAQRRLQHGSNVKSELVYLDLLKHFEHIGDNSLNIAQALRQLY
ncbi:MAG: Na/Pi cotransporter family protein [Candidatus Cloacimonetes bacterium]|nr:Na/Pi cotransporter family protein [Candidatus Cloacimonadota bacterium]MCF7869185.1 Na/Pi cotransporter family protein [Candidatus Cloacimonadota bacterium]